MKTRNVWFISALYTVFFGRFFLTCSIARVHLTQYYSLIPFMNSLPSGRSRFFLGVSWKTGAEERNPGISAFYPTVPSTVL